MAIYRNVKGRIPGSSSNGGSNRVPSGPGGYHDPKSPIGGSGYIPGSRPIGDNSPSNLDWLDKIGDILSPIDSFLNGPDSHSTVTSDGTDVTQSLDIQSVIDRITSSQLYIQAYNLFSSSPDYKLFLQRLQGILDSVNSNYNTWFDKVGLSNKYQDSLTEAYNYAIEQIQLLLKEFHEWYNSLPSTQVDQFSAAGINAAITGQGVNGSSLNGSTAQRNFVESTNPTESLSLLSDIALSKIPSVVSTVSSVWKSIQDVRLANRQQDFTESSFLAGMRKSLLEQGFSLGDTQWSSLSDFHSWTQRVSSDPKLSKMLKDSSVSQFFSDLSYNGLMSLVGSNPESWTEQAFGKTFEEFYNDLGNFQIDTYFKKLEYDYMMAKYNRDYMSVRDGEDAGKVQNAIDQMNKFKSEFESEFASQKSSFLKNWIKRVKDSKDPVAKFALSKVLFNDTLVSGLDTADDLLNSGKVGENFRKLTKLL